MSVRMSLCTICGEMDVCQDGLCTQCETEMRELFLVVKEYIQEHPGVDVMEVSTETGVEEKKVLHMINHKWIYKQDSSEDGRLRCSSCGMVIYSGKLCSRCTAKAQARLRGVMDSLKPGDRQPAQPRIGADGKPMIRGSRNDLFSKD